MKNKTTLLALALVIMGWDVNAQQTPELIKNINDQNLNSSPSLLTLIGQKLFFIATNIENGRELWVSDGEPGGTHLVKDLSPGSDPNPLIGAYSSGISNIIELNGLAYFIVQGAALYKSDGTEGGTVEVAAFSTSSLPGVDRLMTNVNGTLYFLKGTTQGSELWKSDGTTAGTSKVHTINADYYYSNFGKFEVTKTIALNNLLIFVADDGARNHEMWVSDGSKEGTFMIKDIRPGSEGSDPQYLTELNGAIYFTANDGAHGYELWKTDGTAGGTYLVKDIEVGPSSGYPENISNVNGELYFSASDETYYGQPWKSDGTAMGTNMFAVIDCGVFYPKNFVSLGSKVIFSVGYDSYPPGLWITDGTSNGTKLLKNITKPEEIVSDGSTAYFRASSYGGGIELWKTNGTELSTVRMKDIFPGSSNSYPNNLTLMGGGVFFSANDGEHGFELWRSNLFAEGQELSINKNDIYKNSMAIYPNPAKNQINLQFPNQVTVDKITIIDLTGKILLQQIENSNQVNIQNLASGMYILQVFSGDMKWQSKFIKD